MARRKAHPTKYAGIWFRSRLEARWAAFFDLVGWKWQYEPIDLENWTPDFWISIPCGHSECIEDVDGAHELYVEVKPYQSIEEFEGHVCRQMDPYESPHPAAFGWNPDTTEWEMVHGHGSGIYSVPWAVGDRSEMLWREAGNLTQWRRKR